MPLSIFIDALPYNEIEKNYSEWLGNMQIAELIPNIAYSSSLHWQLYCNKYPDERGVLVDWTKENEKRKSVRFFSAVCRPFDSMGKLGIVSKKVLDKWVFRKNTFANIPFKFRKYFSQKGKYLFWKKETYEKEEMFVEYSVISQDEGHKSFETTVNDLTACIEAGNKKIFAVFGFADSLGHKCKRGELYSQRLKPYMDILRDTVNKYIEKNPKEKVLIVSDHGMSTIKKHIDFDLEKKFGPQSKNTYMVYKDSAIMSIWTENENLKAEISNYLSERSEGHLLTDADRELYKVTDKKFGDIIYNLREGNVFSNNWFGKSLKKPSPDGAGMHGFWPEWDAKDQMACIILLGEDITLSKRYDYRSAYSLIKSIMSGEMK